MSSPESAVAPNDPPKPDLRPDLQAVDELASAYTNILEHLRSIPAFSRQDIDYPKLPADADTKLVKRLAWPGLLLWWLRLPFYPIRGWWRSFVIRPVVGFYVSTHINSSVTKMGRALAWERLRPEHDDDTDVGPLDRSIARLERLRTVTTSWLVLLVLLRFVPVIGLLFSMGIVTVSFTLRDTPSLFLQVIGALPIPVLLIHPIVVQFGFRWKRALFAGGGETRGPTGMPGENVYELEQRTSRGLGLRRAKEFPIDLALAPGYYFLVNWIVGLAFGTTGLNEDGELTPQEETIAVIMFVGVSGIFLAIATTHLWLRYKHRRASGFI